MVFGLGLCYENRACKYYRGALEYISKPQAGLILAVFTLALLIMSIFFFSLFKLDQVLLQLLVVLVFPKLLRLTQVVLGATFYQKVKSIYHINELQSQTDARQVSSQGVPAPSFDSTWPRQQRSS